MKPSEVSEDTEGRECSSAYSIGILSLVSYFLYDVVALRTDQRDRYTPTKNEEEDAIDGHKDARHSGDRAEHGGKPGRRDEFLDGNPYLG